MAIIRHNNDGEHRLQVACVKWARAAYPDVVICAIPNGGKRTKREAGKMIAEGELAGMPDLFFAFPSGSYHGLFIEMKYKDGRVRKEQRSVMAQLEAHLYKCVCARTYEGFKAACIEYLGEPKVKVIEHGTRRNFQQNSRGGGERNTNTAGTDKG